MPKNKNYKTTIADLSESDVIDGRRVRIVQRLFGHGFAFGDIGKIIYQDPPEIVTRRSQRCGNFQMHKCSRYRFDVYR